MSANILTYLKAVLDDISVGILLTDRQGDAVLVNSALRGIAGERDGLHLRDMSLVLHRADEDAELQRLLENWRSAPEHLERSCLSVSRPSGLKPYGLVLRPISVAEPDKGGARLPLLLTYVFDPQRPSRTGMSMLNGLFGLSSAEERLTTALICTGTLQTAARACGITEGSARQYMKRIFHKTNTSGQVELIALILGSTLL